MTLAGVVLAAGEGTRLRPLTLLRPKALCPVGGRALLDLALGRLAPHVGKGPQSLAVNAHALADQVVAAVGDRAHLSREEPAALGTAGALGLLRSWLDGRDVLLTNADAYLPPAEDGTAGLGSLLDGGPGRRQPWDGRRCRLLCVRRPGPADFGDLRYVGACLLPWHQVARLEPVPSGLYEVLWRAAFAAGELDLVEHAGPVVDCGTPADYLRANLLATSGSSAISPGAVVEGEVVRSVVWDGAYVGPHERLVECVRAGTRERPVTVAAGTAAGPAPSGA